MNNNRKRGEEKAQANVRDINPPAEAETPTSDETLTSTEPAPSQEISNVVPEPSIIVDDSLKTIPLTDEEFSAVSAGNDKVDELLKDIGIKVVDILNIHSNLNTVTQERNGVINHRLKLSQLVGYVFQGVNLDTREIILKKKEEQ